MSSSKRMHNLHMATKLNKQLILQNLSPLLFECVTLMINSKSRIPNPTFWAWLSLKRTVFPRYLRFLRPWIVKTTNTKTENSKGHLHSKAWFSTIIIMQWMLIEIGCGNGSWVSRVRWNSFWTNQSMSQYQNWKMVSNRQLWNRNLFPSLFISWADY